MPMRKELYPRNWKKISKDIVQKAGNCCEWCGLRNHSVGVRLSNGQFIETPHLFIGQQFAGHKVFQVVLTVAHLDHDPANCADDNLVALCQLDHLRYDVKHHAANAAATRRRKREQAGQMQLIG